MNFGVGAENRSAMAGRGQNTAVPKRMTTVGVQGRLQRLSGFPGRKNTGRSGPECGRSEGSYGRGSPPGFLIRRS